MVNDRSRKLHFSSIVVDTHSDSLGRAVDDGEDLGRETGRGRPFVRASGPRAEPGAGPTIAWLGAMLPPSGHLFRVSWWPGKRAGPGFTALEGAGVGRPPMGSVPFQDPGRPDRLQASVVAPDPRAEGGSVRA